VVEVKFRTKFENSLLHYKDIKARQLVTCKPRTSYLETASDV